MLVWSCLCLHDLFADMPHDQSMKVQTGSNDNSNPCDAAAGGARHLQPEYEDELEEDVTALSDDDSDGGSDDSETCASRHVPHTANDEQSTHEPRKEELLRGRQQVRCIGFLLIWCR